MHGTVKLIRHELNARPRNLETHVVYLIPRSELRWIERNGHHVRWVLAGSPLPFETEFFLGEDPSNILAELFCRLITVDEGHTLESQADDERWILDGQLLPEPMLTETPIDDLWDWLRSGGGVS